MAVVVRFLDLQVAILALFFSVYGHFCRFGVGFNGLTQVPKVDCFVRVTFFTGYGYVSCRNVGYVVAVFEFRTGQAFEVLGQFDRHAAVLCTEYADIAGRYQVCVGDPPCNVQLGVQFTGYDGVVIAFEFQSVIQGGYLTGFSFFIFVDDTGNAVFSCLSGFSVFPVNAGCSFTDCDVCRTPVFAVDADFSVNAVFARRSVCTRCPFCTQCNFIVQGKVIGQLAVVVHFLDLQVAVGFVFFSVYRNFSRFDVVLNVLIHGIAGHQIRIILRDCPCPEHGCPCRFIRSFRQVGGIEVRFFVINHTKLRYVHRIAVFRTCRQVSQLTRSFFGVPSYSDIIV